MKNTHGDGPNVDAKKAAASTVDPATRDALTREAAQGRLACAAAFKVASALKRPAAEIGAAADLLGIRLVECQLGLFGYTPQKKIVTAATAVDPKLADAVRRGLDDGRLPCREAWALAESFALPRMAVSAACEALGVKIKPCQLGAF